MPWWGWALVVVLLAAIPVIPTTIATVRSLGRARRDIREVKDEVKNSHPTNLRADLDELATTVQRVEGVAALALEGAHRNERLSGDILRSLRAVEHSLDRRDKLHLDAIVELQGTLDSHLTEASRRWEVYAAALSAEAGAEPPVEDSDYSAASDWR